MTLLWIERVPKYAGEEFQGNRRDIGFEEVVL